MKIHSIICMSCSGHMNAVNLLGISWWCVSARFVSCAVWQLNISLTWFNRARMKYVYLFFNFLCSICIYSFSEMLLHFKVLLLICICCYAILTKLYLSPHNWAHEMTKCHNCMRCIYAIFRTHFHSLVFLLTLMPVKYTICCAVCWQKVLAQCSRKFCIIQKFIITADANSNAFYCIVCMMLHNCRTVQCSIAYICDIFYVMFLAVI